MQSSARRFMGSIEGKCKSALAAHRQQGSAVLCAPGLQLPTRPGPWERHKLLQIQISSSLSCPQGQHSVSPELSLQAEICCICKLSSCSCANKGAHKVCKATCQKSVWYGFSLLHKPIHLLFHSPSKPSQG